MSNDGNKETSTEVVATDGNGQVPGEAPTQEESEQVAAAAARQPSKVESFFAVTKSLVIRALIIYFISSFFRKPAVNNQEADSKTATNAGPKVTAWNFFDNGTLFDLHVYLSENFNEVDFKENSNLIWLQEDLLYGDWSSGRSRDGTYKQSVIVKATKELMNNGSIYLHTYVTRAGQSPDPSSPNYAKEYYGYSRKQLNRYKKIRINRNYNLLAGEKEKAEIKVNDLVQKDKIVSYWHPNITINLVVDQTNWAHGSIPQPLDEYVQFVDNGRTYLPILFLNDYWNLQREYIQINESTPELELHLTYQPLTMFKWQLYAAQAMKNKWAGNMFGDLMTSGSDESDEDQDSIKETLLETNIYLLGLTIAVSILHSVFELLAFKNDIQFWNNRQSLEGLSVRSVFFAVFQSLIVLLYVLDNETNFMIRMSCFVGLGIEVWKIHKVVDIKYNTNDKIFGLFPKISFTDKGSYVQSATKEYDNLAFKYLSWACFPLLIGFFMYSLFYNEHKGWYSFILNMLYGYLLTFGFIMMTPQLFINYKLKSVAHMPWRMMTYKFLNTFIDDIFAFVIKMPTMYRLGCFRDDIVFFVFLYQRYQYKVDRKRVNEFGFSGEMEETAVKGKKDNQTEVSAIEAKPADEKKQD